MSGMTLVEFILARLDEDERVARDASRRGGPHWPDGQRDVITPQLRHTRRHDPARVLAEVAAKRAIVELHEPYASESHGGAACWVCGPGGFPWPCTTLRLLAMPYADHADYREDWKP